MSASNCCSCLNSADKLKTSEPVETGAEDGSATALPKSRGPHAVKRRKYNPDDLATTGFQCNVDICDDLAANVHMDIQCDIEPDDDNAESICSVCKCSSGFCNPQCEAAKRNKMNRNTKSDSWRSPKASGIPVAVKRNSSPGLTSLVVDPKSSCKCVSKCTPECEKRKLTEAIAATKRSSGQQKCAENQCRSACNVKVQTDMEEAPIAPLAAIPLDTSGQPVQKLKSEASNVCIACQCNGPCHIDCTIKKQGIKQLFTADEMNVSNTDVCAKCDCTGECNLACQDAKLKKAQANPVCDICKCSSTCSPECTRKKTEGKAKENQTDDATVPTCHCATMCKTGCDQYKETQVIPDELVPKENQATACQICECVGACNEACLSAKEKKEVNQSAKKVCEPCVCPNVCIEECQTAKIAAKAICEECVCNAACTPQCEDKKKQTESTPKICKTCNCCGQCTPECEEAKLKRGRSSKELRFNEVKAIPPNNTADETTQVNGIIEKFNDDNALIEHADDNPQSPKAKAISTCNVPGEAICENCECTDGCQPKCAAVRKIRSAADYPPIDAVCEDCKCVEKCTKACDMKKSNITCVSAAGQPIKCNDSNPDWIPCRSCKPDTPCSPECRERMALASVMPKPPEPGAPYQCSEPKVPVETCATPVQTAAPAPVACSNVQTVTCADGNPVVRSTSTPNGLIQREEFEAAQKPKPSSGEPPEQDEAPCSCDDDSASSLSVDEGERCPGDQGQQRQQEECGMCLKLRSYICSMFHNENATCQQDAAPAKKTAAKSKENSAKKPESCGNKVQSNDNFACKCLEVLLQKKKEQHAPQRSHMGDEGRPCKCSKSLGQKKSSYTDRMQCMMSHLRASCEDAELVALPFIKAASAFSLDVSNQQEAIVALLQKCRQKDHYIDALINDVMERSKSKVFDTLLSRLKEQNPGAPDFDGALISSALDKTKKNGPVCGIDLTGFKICSVKRVGATSLLAKWNGPVDGRVCGYDINVNGQLKTRIGCKDRTYAILDALDFSITISIEIYAMTPNGRAYPSVLAYYAKY